MVYLPHAAEAARLSQSVRIRIFLNFSINIKYLPSCESSKTVSVREDRDGI